MKKIIATLLLLITVSVGGRAEAQAPDLAHYLQQLQLKLDHAAQRANQPSAGGSSVVGVRGAAQEPLSKQLYWKGKKPDMTLTTDEIKAARAAVEQARAGQTQQAVVSLKAFDEKYPKSALKPDVDETLRRLEAPPAKS